VDGIIRPARPRRLPDPYITPIYGKRGPCALCLNYSDLTENHVPPEAAGNDGNWIAQSYLVDSTANKDLYRGRSFNGGIRFRTICATCNNSLGGREDKAIVSFFDGMRMIVESPIIVAPLTHVCAKPNLVYKGLLAHVVSANDGGVPSAFDSEAREIFFGRRSLRLSSWNLFYWIYIEPSCFLMRNAYLAAWQPSVEVNPVQILKTYPLGFVFTRKSYFFGLANNLNFVTPRDDDETDIPIFVYRRENHAVWPALSGGSTTVMLAGDSFGLIRRRR
jgi:hypothetical protein